MHTITIPTEFLSPDTLAKMYRDIQDLQSRKTILEVLKSLVGHEDAWKMIHQELNNR